MHLTVSGKTESAASGRHNRGRTIMDTAEVAQKLGTTPRQLRQFLRSPLSTFVAVGSGARYDFTDADLPTLQRRFSDWQSGTSKGTRTRTSSPPRPTRKPAQPSKSDLRVWAEEGPVEMDDIRRPEVRARVKAAARAAEDQLMMLLMSKGMHISQLGDSRKAS